MACNIEKIEPSGESNILFDNTLAQTGDEKLAAKIFEANHSFNDSPPPSAKAKSKSKKKLIRAAKAAMRKKKTTTDKDRKLTINAKTVGGDYRYSPALRKGLNQQLFSLIQLRNTFYKGGLSNEEQEQLRLELLDKETAFDALIEQADIGKFVEYGEKSLNEIETRLDGTLSDRLLLQIGNELEAWGTMVDYFAEEEGAGKSIIGIDGRARLIHNKYLGKLRDYYLQRANSDMLYNKLLSSNVESVEEISAVAANVLDLSRYEDKLTQSIDYYLKESQRNTEQEFKDMIQNPLNDWKQVFKDGKGQIVTDTEGRTTIKPMSYTLSAGESSREITGKGSFEDFAKEFFENGELILKYDKEYYKQYGEQSKIFWEGLKNGFNMQAGTDTRGATARNYYKWRRENSVMVDIETLLGANRQKEVDRLTGLMGEEAAMSLIKRAESNYQYYEKLLEIKKQLYPDTQKVYTVKDVATTVTETSPEVLAFMEQFDPKLAFKAFYNNEFGNKFPYLTDENNNPAYMNAQALYVFDEKFATTSPLRQWHNPKYTAIKEDTGIKGEFFKWFVKTNSKLINNLPKYMIDNKSSFLFEVPKDMLELWNTYKVNGIFTPQMQEMFRQQSISMLTTNESPMSNVNPATNEPDNTVPTFFANNTLLRINNRQKALVKLIADKEKLAKLAKGTDAEQEILDELEVLETEQQTLTDKKKEFLETHTMDIEKMLTIAGAMSINFKHKTIAQPIIELGAKILKESAEIKRNSKNEELMDFNGDAVRLKNGALHLKSAVQYAMDAILYGKKQAKEGVLSSKKITKNTPFEDKERAKVLKAEIKELKAQYKATPTDPVKEEISMKTKELEGLGENVTISKLTNLLMSYTQLKSMGFNPFSGAAQLGFGILSNLVESGGNQEFGTGDMVKAMGIVNKAVWTEEGRNKLRNMLKKFAVDINMRTPEKVKPFFFLTYADYYNKGTTMVAMLLQQKDTETGKPMWEMFDQNGNYTGTNQENWRTPKGTKQNEYSVLRGKIRQTIKTIHGVTGDDNALAAKKTAIGRLLGQFRLSWIPEGINNRLGGAYQDAQLGREVEGRWRTYYKLGIPKSLKVLGDIALRRELNKDGEMSATDIANMRKNLMELLFLVTLAGIIMALEASIDDDDEGNYFLTMTLNQISRVRGDVIFYLSPSEFNKIIKDPIPVMRTIKDFGNIYDGMVKYTFKETPAEMSRYDDEYMARRVMQAFPFSSVFWKAQQQATELYNK